MDDYQDKRSGHAVAGAIAAAAGVELWRCYQCGKCAAGCPMAGAMDLSPRRILRCLQQGLADELLASRAIWLCAACHTCSERCPNEINIPGLIERARQEAERRGVCAVPEARVFTDTFLENVRLFGRSQEMLLEGVYNLATGNLTQDFESVPHMLRHGLAGPEIESVRDTKGLREIMKAAAKEDEGQ
ncbi:MAG: 4Fe-4S dicluster domain-containing protein [Clostridia bacterium]|nr:4Fe-4S dicluster domain-containing protein [Clostridia bacterium]